MARTTSRPQASPLARVLDERVEKLRKLFRRSLRSWDAETIRQARVTTRRLAAAVDLLRPLLREEKSSQFAKALRKIRRTLGPARDLDAMLAHLEALGESADRNAAAAWATQRLRGRREDQVRRSSTSRSVRKVLSRLGAWADLEPQVRDSQDKAALLMNRAAPAQMRAFARHANRLTRPRSKRHVDRDAHDLRIIGKLLRYTLELAPSLGFDMHEAAAADFKKLQDALGLWHDHAVLSTELLRLALDAELWIQRPGTYSDLLSLATTSWNTAEQQLDQFRRLWAANGGALTARVLSSFSTDGRSHAARRNGSPRGPASERTARAFDATAIRNSFIPLERD